MLRAERAALRSSPVAHILYGSALVSAVNSDACRRGATLCRTPLSRTAAASLLAFYFSRPKAVESRCVRRAAGRAGRDGAAPYGKRCSRVSQHQQHMGVVPLATDLPVAAPADARDRNARSCRRTRLRTWAFYPATRLRCASIGKLTTDMPPRFCFPYEA